MDAQPHQESPRPIPRRSASVEAVFERLLATWNEEMRFESSFHKLVGHPTYQEIIALGIDAVPLILREFEKKPDWLGPALASITGESPITEDMAGHLPKQTEAWLAWGRSRGYI